MPKNIISWIFGILFFIIGILNAFLVHLAPGVFYVLLSLLYFPFTKIYLKKKYNFHIPYGAMIIAGFIILWMTLAVGDLAEIYGL